MRPHRTAPTFTTRRQILEALRSGAELGLGTRHPSSPEPIAYVRADGVPVPVEPQLARAVTREARVRVARVHASVSVYVWDPDDDLTDDPAPVQTTVHRDDRHECDACGIPLAPGDRAWTDQHDDYVCCSPACLERLTRRRARA